VKNHWTAVMRQMQASLDLVEILREKGREASRAGKPATACRYRIPWCRQQWVMGWQEAEHLKSVECSAKSKRGRW